MSETMTDKPPQKMLSEEEREAERRFQETLSRMANTPHKPHKPIRTPEATRKAKP